MDFQFSDVLLSVLSLVLLAVPGVILGKLKLLPENATKVLTSVLLFIGQPMLTFTSFQKCAYDATIVNELLIVAGLAILVHAIMIALIFGLFYKKSSNNEKLRIVSFASIFGNCGFMGLPFLQTLFGSTSSKPLMYGAVVIAVFNAFSWTVGIFFITRDKKFISPKKAFINPPFIALLVSLPLFLILKKPITAIGAESSFVNEMFKKIFVSANYLGELVTPLSMIILGLRLAEIKIKDLFLNGYAYLSSTLKLVAMPLLAFFICVLLKVPELIKWAIFFEFCMPTATQTLLFSEQYGNQPHMASVSVLLATLVSVATIPLMYLLVSITGL